MAYRLPSYKPDACCINVNCHHGWKPDEPCWGDVTVADEMWTEDNHYWIHACEGHWDYSADYTSPYKPSDRPEDQGAVIVEDDE